MDLERQEWPGTALRASSRVWFTLSHGILNEVYYPRRDVVLQRIQFTALTGPMTSYQLPEQIWDGAPIRERELSGADRFHVLWPEAGRWEQTDFHVSAETASDVTFNAAASAPDKRPA